MKIVFTNGCFRFPHRGHKHMLQEARSYGDYLVVAINSDECIERIKPGRAFLPFSKRLEHIRDWRLADICLWMDQDTPGELLKVIRPAVLFKGGSTKDIYGAQFVANYGGIVVRGSLLPGCSSSIELDRILDET